MERESLPGAIRTVLICLAVGALVGAGLGLVVALAFPRYYRGVFEGGQSPDFEPLPVGVGLGATQGAVAGFCLGLVLVWIGRPEARKMPVSKVGVAALVAVGVVGVGALSVGRLFDESRGQGMTLAWRGKVLGVHNYGLSDRVATHLAMGWAQAALEPAIYLRSHATEIEIDPARLKWIDADGKPTVAPDPGERVEIVTHIAFATSTAR